MIRVLVFENRSRSRLSLLLRELGQSADFHSDIDSLLVSSRGDGKTADPILFDLHSRTAEGNPCFPLLKAELEGRVFIGFEEFDSGSIERGSKRPEGLSQYLLLPPQAERAKARLKAVLAECRRRQNSSSASRGMTSPKGFRRAFTPSVGARSFSRKTAVSRPSSEEKPFRYLVTHSVASRNFGRKLLDSLSFETLLFLSGERGAELTLAAREFQYQLRGDEESLVILPLEDVDLETLHDFEKQAKDSGVHRICYIDQCEDAPPEAAEAILQFVENVENMRNPHLRLLLGREEDRDFIYGETAEIFARLGGKRSWLRLPSLSDRTEDIRAIANGFLSALTFAHPFLNVKEIDPAALKYLEENCARFSYQTLVQALRNSIALGQNRVLRLETIQDFLPGDISAEHLVESTADEAFFPQSEACFTS